MNDSASIRKAAFGSLGGKQVVLFTLTNRSGLLLKVANYGAIVTELHVPDRAGRLGDIVLGFEHLEGYLTSNWYFGATVGRVANRIRNARFELGGQEYKLSANDGTHTLHGGNRGFDKVVWDAEPQETAEGPALVLTYRSADGEEGFPASLTARTTYVLTQQNEFKVTFTATSDRTTPVNLAHHTYWNLGGSGAGPITDHELTLFSEEYTPGDPRVPTGQRQSVRDTPFDFTAPKPIGRDLAQLGGEPLGYDHNFVVLGDRAQLRPVARVRDPKSGRVMTLKADQPGVQLYSGNFLNGTTRGKGVSHAQHTGFCLETQAFPNAINLPAWRDQALLEPGQIYQHRMIHRFTVD